jgi:hypothetical protein
VLAIPCSVVDLTPSILVQVGESVFTPEVTEILRKLGRLLSNAFLESEELPF